MRIYLPAWFAVAFVLPVSGGVRGRVVDPNGAGIPEARIALSNAVVVSNIEGEFELDFGPGEYSLKISAKGFVEIARDVRFESDSETLIEMKVTPSHAEITVADAASSIEAATSTATRTRTPLIDVPQSIAVVNRRQMDDQLMTSIGDVVRYVPGITAIQGENNRDQLVIRGNSTSADFFVNGVRDDVQYYRDLYNLEKVEAIKGPNAMTFGRGGAGGVINRVTKDAGFTPLRELTLQGGAFGDKRVAVDLDQPLNCRAAVRLNGMFEDSDSFRDYVGLRRYGVSPTLTLAAGANTRITFLYENFRDDRGSDRGLPSLHGRPLDLPVNTFIGNPDLNNVRALVNSGVVSIEHQHGALNIRNQTSVSDYDRGYQNFVPGAVTSDGQRDSVSAYNNATARRNLFSQTDLTYTLHTGRVEHTLLGGMEAGRQVTDNLRNTGYFNNSDTSILVPLSDTVFHTPVTFRQSATDANNHLQTNLVAPYVQDQAQLSRFVQVIGGVRFDYFDLQYHDNRTGNNLRRIDRLVSPRAGVVFKPLAKVSIYGSYSVSFLPSSGDQFSSLTVITQQVKPERFNNYEAGVKWDAARALSFTAAVYRLDRKNTRSTDPNDPTRIVQTGSQRTNGVEVGWTGSVSRKWRIAGGYAYQDAFVSSATTSAFAGARVAQVPRNSFSLWNEYQVFRRLGLGLGVLNRCNMFAAIDDAVVLPGYTRFDGAVFYRLGERTRLQVNLENLGDRRYILNADNNNNLSPGSPRMVRVGLTTRF